VTHPQACITRRPGAAGYWILGLAVGAGIAMIASRLILKSDPGPALVALSIVLPLPLLGAMIVVIARAARHLDEMHRLIQFEALALTVPVSALLVVLYGQLQKAGILPMDDAALAYAIISLTYAACYFIAARRYS
jgi:hypothetical protein